MTKNSVLASLVLSLLLGLSPLAAAPIVVRGIDVFTTPADGKTFYDFAKNPIPAGFFCKASTPFRGRVAFKGLPLVTEVAGQLGSADTVVERLDDAVFNEKGRATTRVKFRALSLVSIAPVQTACGAFNVYVSLGPTQRMTMMTIHRTKEDGGRFIAPLAADIRLTFIPVKSAQIRKARKLELPGSFTFPGISLPWSFTDGAKNLEMVKVDTDGDLTPDHLVPGPSNFYPGQVSLAVDKTLYCCVAYVCHKTDGCQHCSWQYPVGCQGECP